MKGGMPMNNTPAPADPRKDAARYREVRHKSVAPYYAAAVSWFLYALFCPMYKLGHFFIIALITAAELLILGHLIKPRIEYVPIPYTPPKAGIDDVDAVISSGAEYVRKFDEMVPTLEKYDPSVALRLSHIREVLDTIFQYVSKNPDRVTRIRRFMNYYLPTLEKLMNTYLELSAEKLQPENVKKTLAGIDGILDTIGPAFEKQLNSLYEDQVVDITSDIKVLETMLAGEGLGKQ